MEELAIYSQFKVRKGRAVAVDRTALVEEVDGRLDAVQNDDRLPEYVEVQHIGALQYDAR